MHGRHNKNMFNPHYHPPPPPFRNYFKMCGGGVNNVHAWELICVVAAGF